MKPAFHRHQWGFTPYNWSLEGGWRIGYGVSSFLVAEGSMWSAPVGRELLRRLNDEYRKPNTRRLKKRREGN